MIFVSVNRKLIIGLLFGCFVLLFACDVNESGGLFILDEGAHIEESLQSDIPQHVETLNNEFKDRTCVLPRRIVQSVHSFVKLREQKAQKVFWQNRLSGENRFYKTVELNTDCQITYFATLLCRKGYYVYTLRKLLI